MGVTDSGALLEGVHSLGVRADQSSAPGGQASELWHRHLASRAWHQHVPVAPPCSPYASTGWAGVAGLALLVPAHGAVHDLQREQHAEVDKVLRGPLAAREALARPVQGKAHTCE